MASDWLRNNFVTNETAANSLREGTISCKQRVKTVGKWASSTPGNVLERGSSTQYSVMTYMGKESKKEWIYVYV